MKTLPTLEDFPASTFDKLRYGDTDKLGHVNNAVFVTFLESGRTALFDEAALRNADHDYVVARVTIDYLAEVFWPGTVEIGTGLKSLGNSSAVFLQAVFQNGKCVATAEVVVVQVDRRTRRPAPISPALRESFEKLTMPA